MKSHNGLLFPIVSIAIIAALIGITMFNWKGGLKREIGSFIAEDVAHLANIFEKIDTTAGILGFDHQKTDIDFLNIKKNGFIGSEVGSMNLIHPDKWEGPYEKEIPRMEEEDYMVVRTKHGYFITPGDGVKLPNGKIIGKDIILDEDADIEQMMIDDQMLSYHGKSLAAKIHVTGKHGTVQPIFPEED